MFQMRVVLFVFLYLNLFGNTLIGQTALPKKNDVRKLTGQAFKFQKAGDFEKSLLTSRLALKQSIAINDNGLIAENYNNIAINYKNLVEYDKAILYYKKALTFASLSQNDTIKQGINNNLGNVYCFEKKKYKIGIYYFKKALECSERIKDTFKMALTNLNIAWVSFDIGKFNEGEKNLMMTNSYFQKHPNNMVVVPLSMLNGMYYNYKNQDEKAESYFEKAIDLGSKSNLKSFLSTSYLEYSKFLSKRKDYKRAYENLQLYTKLNNEIFAEEKLEKARVVGINLHLDEYKRTIDKIENEKNLQSQSLKQSRIIELLFGLIIFVLLLFVISLYRNNKFRVKTNADLKIANRQLIIANKKAEELSNLKTQFVSTISHELRTPLYGVVGITDLLLEEHKELASSPHLNSLKFSARYLLSLVNDILQINKIEENKLVLEEFTFNLSDEFNIIKSSLSFIAQNNKNKIYIDVDPSIPESLIGDKLRFAQILMNLVSNALKFTKNGEVRLIAKQIGIKEKLHSIEVKVVDTGIGIAPLDQEIIFEKFVQVGNKEANYQGTGLGLQIVKRLLELFGSNITLESELGKGTTFTFCINFECDADKSSKIMNNIQIDLDSNQLFKILVVEDNPINQLITRKIIEKNNYSCIVVDDGYKAIEILDKEEFDIILMDISMPLIDGYETAKKIREKGIKTPIIALTAFDKNEITEAAIQSGMNEVIVKPFEAVQLVKIINGLILNEKKLV